MSQAPDFEFEPARGLKEEEIANVFIPDLPRGINQRTAFEVNHFLFAVAAEVFLRRPPGERGLIVAGESIRWPRTPDSSNNTAWRSLIREGVPEDSIVSAATGVDPVTNFIRAQGLFKINAAVGIVTPKALWSMHRHIAERTMERDYGGLLVPPER